MAPPRPTKLRRRDSRANRGSDSGSASSRPIRGGAKTEDNIHASNQTQALEKCFALLSAFYIHVLLEVHVFRTVQEHFLLLTGPPALTLAIALHRLNFPSAAAQSHREWALITAVSLSVLGSLMSSSRSECPSVECDQREVLLGGLRTLAVVVLYSESKVVAAAAAAVTLLSGNFLVYSTVEGRFFSFLWAVATAAIVIAGFDSNAISAARRVASAAAAEKAKTLSDWEQRVPESAEDVTLLSIDDILSSEEVAVLELTKVDMREIELKQRIGIGSFANVYEGLYKKTVPVAVKVLSKAAANARAVECLALELLTMSRVRHRNVLQYIGHSLSPFVCVITEFAERGSLGSILRDRSDERVSWISPLVQIAADVARGMTYLAEMGIVHNDLKADNVMVSRYWTAMVGDLGLAKRRAEDFSKTDGGSPGWLSPEKLRGEPSSEKSDVYSFGVLMWEMCSGGEIPFFGSDEIACAKATLSGERPPLSPDYPLPVVRLLRRCWAQDQRRRPKFSSLLSLIESEVAVELQLIVKRNAMAAAVGGSEASSEESASVFLSSSSSRMPVEPFSGMIPTHKVPATKFRDSLSFIDKTSESKTEQQQQQQQQRASDRAAAEKTISDRPTTRGASSKQRGSEIVSSSRLYQKFSTSADKFPRRKPKSLGSAATALSRERISLSGQPSPAASPRVSEDSAPHVGGAPPLTSPSNAAAAATAAEKSVNPPKKNTPKRSGHPMHSNDPDELNELHQASILLKATRMAKKKMRESTRERQSRDMLKNASTTDSGGSSSQNSASLVVLAADPVERRPEDDDSERRRRRPVAAAGENSPAIRESSPTPSNVSRLSSVPEIPDHELQEIVRRAKDANRRDMEALGIGASSRSELVPELRKPAVRAEFAATR